MTVMHVQTRSTVRSHLVPLATMFFAMGQAVATLLFDILSPQRLTSGAEISPLVPPGGWFAIWGVIITLSIVWAVTSCRPSAIGDPLRRRVSAGLLVTYVGFSVWLTCASQGQSTPATLPVLAVMALALLWVARTLTVNDSHMRGWPAWDRALAALTVGIYLGWTSMATWINLATVAQGAGAPTTGAWGAVWQTGVLALAAGTAVGVVVLTRGSLAYAATVAYALTGIAVSTAAAGFALLTGLAVAALVLVAASTAIIRISARRRQNR